MPEPTTSPASPLPEDSALCPGEAMHAAHLRQLLRAALPDSSHHKAAGWFGQTDFLFTHSHVDEEQDAYHDGLFITLWKRWDFWLALPPAGAAQRNLLAQAWARLSQGAPAAEADGLLRQYRAYDGAGRPGPWQPLDAAHAPPDALQDCAQAWRAVIAYWRRAEGQRRAGRPLRARLHATLTPARVQALTLLPVFTGRYNDWWDPERNGWWEGDVWIGARQPGQQGGRHWGRALKLSWRNGSEAAGDEEDDAHACYQIDLVDDDAPSGTAHPPGLRLSYSQRQSDARSLLTNDAVEHMERLLQLFTSLEQRLYAAHAQEQQALQAGAPASGGPAPALPRTPPFAPDESDAEVFGAAIMALSHAWQSSGRSHASLVRELWAAQADAAQPPDAPAADAPTPPPLADPRLAQASGVLRLAHTVHALADQDLSARFHRRFAFAPGAFAHHAARGGRAVGPLLWQSDGRLLAHVGPATGAADQAGSWWQLGADGLHLTPLPSAQAPHAVPPQAGHATAHGVTVRGDEAGDLHGLADDGRALWRHHLGGAIRSIAPAPDGHALAVGTAGGYLVLLHKGSGTDPYLVSTSRYAEARRFIFWGDTAAPLAW
ncbi:MAG: hypothetical protein JSR53_17615 [Proteobacteria bacterium]|nr:hypothetical protein [Pseudomonadota bacterium]